MANLVSDIMSLNTKDLEQLAQALAWYSAVPNPTSRNKAQDLEFYLNAHNKEQEETWVRRMAEKAAA
jgi:hypothetical protein